MAALSMEMAKFKTQYQSYCQLLFSVLSLSLSLSHLFSLCSRPDTESIRNENIDPLLSLAQTTPPEDSSASDRTEPAVLLLPPLTALPVDTLNTFS